MRERGGETRGAIDIGTEKLQTLIKRQCYCNMKITFPPASGKRKKKWNKEENGRE
jgi:hypothetical protein